MTPRPRRPGSQALPANLYANRRPNGRLSYIYRHPLTGKRTGMGTNRHEAIAAARVLNDQLVPTATLVDRVLAQPARTLGAWLDRFEEQILPEQRVGKKQRPMAPATLAGYRQRLAKLRDWRGEAELAGITLEEIADFLAALPARTSVVYRATMMVVWRHARAAGWLRPDSPDPGHTIARQPVVQRQPLDYAGYLEVLEAAPAWLQAAMALGLESLQARAELAAMRWDHRDGEHLYVIRRKVEAHGTAARLRIRVWPELDAAMRACRDDLASPYLVHRKPVRVRSREARAAGRDHPTQVMPEEISRGFAEARDKVPRYAAMAPAARPTFHEVRALGAARKREAGWPETLIQALMAHSTVGMTQHYLEKHAEPWTEIQAPTG